MEKTFTIYGINRMTDSINFRKEIQATEEEMTKIFRTDPFSIENEEFPLESIQRQFFTKRNQIKFNPDLDYFFAQDPSQHLRHQTESYMTM